MPTGARHSLRLGRACVAASLVLLGTAACVQPVGPARTADDYSLKASSTLEAARSAVGTAQVVADAAVRDRILATLASVTLAEAEGDATSARETFAGIQPPGRSSDVTRTTVLGVVDDVVGLLADLRIAARRGDLGPVGAARDPLRELARRLADVEAAL